MIKLPVDHLVAVVPDLAAAGAAFNAAGFTTTPMAEHSAAMGTANICVMFRNGYLELMGIVQPTEANAGWRGLLELGPGLRGVALDSPDIAASAAALTAAGLRHEPVRQFSRSLPEGDLRFSVIRIARAVTPGLQCLYCQHHSRALLWQPQLLVHANGATDMLSAALPDAAALAPLAALAADGMALQPGASALQLAQAPKAAPVAASALRAVAQTCGLQLQFR